MKQLTEAVLATLIYHDLFDYPLTQKEIWHLLLLNSKFKIQNLKFKCKIKNCLHILINKRKISQKQGFYFLFHRSNIIKKRLKRKKYSQEKFKKAQKIARLLKLFISEIKMLAVTGALAMNNADKNDDIDLLIITISHRLWLTRLKLIIVLEILGQRRRPNAKNAKNIKDKICLNMFLDETALALAANKRNLFTAHEVVQMKPILNKDQTYEKFLKANLWVKNYLPNGTRIKNDNLESRIKKSCILNTKYFILDLLEKLACRLQLRYMSSKQTSEQVGSHFAFFHPRNRTQQIIDQYQQRCEQHK